MSKLSVIVPSLNERFLPQTVNDLITKASGDTEIICVLDGWWPDPPLPYYKNLVIIHNSVPKGMRASINAAASIAKGKYLLKCDSHVAFSEGYDEVLQADCEDNWVVIPRRYALDAENWVIRPDKEAIDYEHIFWPYAHPDDLGLHARPWMQRARERKDILIDEDMSFQGSAWFCHTEHFLKRIGGLSEVGFGGFMGEPQQIGFITQLGPWEGKVMRTKKTWYAHFYKGHSQWKADETKSGRISSSERTRCNAYSFDYFWNNRWEGRAHDIEWLFERFQPIPGWPSNWLEIKKGMSK